MSFRVAVVGDVMLDAYYFCDVTGFSPEDDLAPKLRLRDKQYRPGGAANVACCLSRWGVAVGLFGVCGNDYSCETLSSLLRKEELERVYLPSLNGRVTTCKTRLVTPKSRQVVRLDEEALRDLNEPDVMCMVQAILDYRPDCLVFSDYDKDVVNRMLLAQLKHLFKDTLTVVDPKRANLDFYGPVFAVTPNHHEFEAFCQAAEDPMHPSCAAKHVVVTRAECGSKVFTGGMQPEFDVPVRRREIGDPAGCGDAFLAALVYELGSGNGLEKACLTASAAGALAFDMLGVACPTLEQIEAELKHPEYKEVRRGHS